MQSYTSKTPTQGEMIRAPFQIRMRMAFRPRRDESATPDYGSARLSKNGPWQAAHKISRRCEEIYINFRSIEGVRQRHKPSTKSSHVLLQVCTPASTSSPP